MYFYYGYSEVKNEICELHEYFISRTKGKGDSGKGKGYGNKGGDSSNVRDVVRQALEEYDADKTTKADFALESAGGLIISVGDTEQFEPVSRSCTLFGIPICQSSNGPRQIIQPSVLPGECWAFKGTEGFAIIKLLGPVFIECVSLEHISKAISPTGQIDTAPREFSIKGLESPEDDVGELLGIFTYDIEGPPLQTFEIRATQGPHEYIEFKVLSNHGNYDFTCVYRLRVHGVLSTAREDL